MVNSLGWVELREVQEECIAAVLSGENLVVLAPTAGGKTEAAFFPLISRMLSERWTGLSILYVSPLRALINNQEARLQRYFELVGHRAATWHGDVPQREKRQILRELPNCLLTTPESLEGLLVSRRTDAGYIFSQVCAVVVDEVHAFAEDDRGWHLLAVLSRISAIAGRPLQRIGLSATVGNPRDLVTWLSADANSPQRVIRPAAVSASEAEVQLDYVGSIENAAAVISKLHRGEKRLVFCDSRAMVEQLAAILRSLDVRTFVVHSSLSKDLRRQAESAFASERDCVVVATSALELGIDVGDLDRVVQINSPGRVAGFLQRMGRTGRRSGATSNCLFLALDQDAVLDCAALLDLWEQGYVEPVEPPPLPYHIFAQQVMALALQNGGIAMGDWEMWLSQVPGFAEIPDEAKRSVVDYMLDEHLLTDDGGVLWFGVEGEKAFGQKHFLELLSVFTTPPVMAVRCGKIDLGTMDRLPLQMALHGAASDLPTILTLAGRHWQITQIDWDRRFVLVEETKYRGKSRWLGSGRTVPLRMAQARLHALCSNRVSPRWSRRAAAAMREIRDEHHWVAGGKIVIRQADKNRWQCWTFAGTLGNRMLAGSVGQRMGCEVHGDAYSVTFRTGAEGEEVLSQLGCALRDSCAGFEERIPEEVATALKFGVCVPPPLARSMLRERWADREALDHLARCGHAVVAGPSV